MKVRVDMEDLGIELEASQRSTGENIFPIVSFGSLLIQFLFLRSA